ncbi:MAG TPA: hypothetical protein VHU40_09585 [Polyangia bacterium]|jgi:hypothetical protein|nr:hypothetical protein [Polyangia bacterium]
MSKNTERGIGLQGGPADGQTAEPTSGAAKSAAPAAPAGSAEGARADGAAPRSDRAAEAPRPAEGSDSRPVTLLGVPSPLGEREKVTALGRDVHLPPDSHRVATSRPIAVTEVAPGPQTARGSGGPLSRPVDDRSALVPAKPDAPRPRLSDAETQPALFAPGAGPTGRSPVSATAATVEAKPLRPTNPADRATFDASPLVVSDEPSVDPPLASRGARAGKPSLGPSIGLGIALAAVLSVVVVSIVRYATLEEVEDDAFTEETTARPATRPVKAAIEPPGTEPGTESGKDLTKATPPAGAIPETAETKTNKPPEPSPAGPEKTQDGDKLGAIEAAAAAKDPRRAAALRARAGTPPRRGTDEPEGATGGSGSAPALSPATASPAPTQPKPLVPGAGSNQPYDPDSPLPPAGE